MTADEKYMMLALEQARIAGEIGEVPVGAVIVHGGKVIASAGNRRENNSDATAHAEVLAISAACKALGGWRLEGCTLYVTLEPCPMCAGAIVSARLDRVVYGAPDEKSGCCGSLCNILHMPFNHTTTITKGILSNECGKVLKDFFDDKRNLQ